MGYDIADGVSVGDYERWLWESHLPDLIANPYLSRIVLNTVLMPVLKTSAGTPTVEEQQTFYRIAELHFADHAAFDRYLRWFEEHPIPPERSPIGRTRFRFYVLTESVELVRPDHD